MKARVEDAEGRIVIARDNDQFAICMMDTPSDPKQQEL